MKTSLQYRLALIVLPLFFLTSCLNDELGPETTGPDPLSYGIYENWKETSKKINVNDWEAIEYGDTLKLYLNYIDASKKNFGGQYFYDPILLNIEVDKTGDVERGEDYIVFIPLLNIKDSIRLPIQLIQDSNDTLLVIHNTLSVPPTEVKYKKVN